MALNGLARLTRKRDADPPSLPSGVRIYAVGDIHGRLDLLDALAEQIRADLVSAPPEVMTIFLGDYVDRGPASAGVLDRLSRNDFPTPIYALRGNHEEIFLRFLDDGTVLEGWRRFGGIETLHSYGVDVMEAIRGGGYDLARKISWRACLPSTACLWSKPASRRASAIISSATRALGPASR